MWWMNLQQNKHPPLRAIKNNEQNTKQKHNRNFIYVRTEKSHEDSQHMTKQGPGEIGTL